MNIRKLAYSLAVVMVSYDVLSTMAAAKMYGRFADLSPVYNFLWQSNPLYVLIWVAFIIPGLTFAFWKALPFVESEKLLDRIVVMSFDLLATYSIIFGSIAVPHNTLVLLGSYGIVQSSEMFVMQEIASALIAGVIVVVVDWKRLWRRQKS